MFTALACLGSWPLALATTLRRQLSLPLRISLASRPARQPPMHARVARREDPALRRRRGQGLPQARTMQGIRAGRLPRLQGRPPRLRSSPETFRTLLEKPGHLQVLILLPPKLHLQGRVKSGAGRAPRKRASGSQRAPPRCEQKAPLGET